MNPTPTKTELLDKFDDCNFVLSFVESALRSLFETGNINETHVSEGLNAILIWLVGEYKKVQEQVRDGFGEDV